MRWFSKRDDEQGDRELAGPHARAWVTVTAREVAPASIVTSIAERAGFPIGEIVSFDGRSVAIELQASSIAGANEHGAPLGLPERAQAPLIATIEALHLHPEVIDLTFETHLAGDEDVRSERQLTFHQLTAEIREDRLLAGVRYLTD